MARKWSFSEVCKPLVPSGAKRCQKKVGTFDAMPKIGAKGVGRDIYIISPHLGTIGAWGSMELQKRWK